jgi:hypothetical protein
MLWLLSTHHPWVNWQRNCCSRAIILKHFRHGHVRQYRWLEESANHLDLSLLVFFLIFYVFFHSRFPFINLSTCVKPLPKLYQNELDRHENTQLMLYLKTSYHSLTTHWLKFGQRLHRQGTSANFIKTIYEVLRNNVRPYETSSVYFN